MNTTSILILIAIIILPATLVGFFIMRMNRSQLRYSRDRIEKFEMGFRRTVDGTARVLQKNETISPAAHGIAKVELQLDVQVPEKAPYQLSTSWLVEVSSLDEIEPGKSLPVKVDAKDPLRIYPNVSWARPWVFDKK
jgi:hypothetical protein